MDDSRVATTDKKSGAPSVLQYMLGTYERSVVIAAIGIGVAVGNIYMFNIVDMSSRPRPLLWETIAGGSALSAFILPGLFMTMARLVPYMSAWKALLLLTGAMLAPGVMQRMSIVGMTDALAFVGGCIVMILFTLPIMIWIMDKLKKSAL
jgi:hypothetical protein